MGDGLAPDGEFWLRLALVALLVALLGFAVWDAYQQRVNPCQAFARRYDLRDYALDGADATGCRWRRRTDRVTA